jgi:Tol biopolymer transport system component
MLVGVAMINSDMKSCRICSFFHLFLVCLLITPFWLSVQTVMANEIHFKRDLTSLPVSFEMNQGQMDSKVKYFTRIQGHQVFFTSEGVIIDLPHAETMEMRFVDANPYPTVTGEALLETRSNYLIGNDPSLWISQVRHYDQVRYHELYPGIDLVFYFRDGDLEYDFVVLPTADPDLIRLEFTGMDKLLLNEEDRLVLSFDTGDIVNSIPSVYQEIKGQRKLLSGKQLLDESGYIRFDLPDYQAEYALVIDPVLHFSRFFGGSGEEEIISLSSDVEGNIFIAGGTSSPDLPVSVDSLSYPSSMFDVEGNRLAFIGKLDPSGTRLIYLTYLGGSRTATAHYVRVDADGYAYATGRTEADDFPTVNPIQSSYGGGSDDVFLSKLSPDGSSLIYSTYLGGSEYDQARSLALDAAGSVYLTGRTESSNYPVVNPIIPNFGGNQDGFITKVSPEGNQIIYSTYLGGRENDIGHAITVDVQGNAYVTGLSNSPDFPTVNTYQDAYRGGDGDDAIIVKLAADGSHFVYSTFIGGSGDDESRAIAVDTNGNAVITGYTRSVDFPTLNALQADFGGPTHDVFVTSLNPDGSDLVFSTYIGGDASDYGRGLALDADDNIYLTGYTNSPDFPLADPIQDHFAGGRGDVIIMKLDPSASQLLYSTYLGGEAHERGRAITVDGSGNILVSGHTQSRDFTVTSFVSPDFGGGEDDAFLVKLMAEDELMEHNGISCRFSHGSCFEADFDSNGLVDFTAPAGEGWIYVFMNLGTDLEKTIELDAGGVSELYAPRDTLGERGEPVAEHPSILIPWVGQNHVVFTWDGTGFKKVAFPGFYE